MPGFVKCYNEVIPLLGKAASPPRVGFDARPRLCLGKSGLLYRLPPTHEFAAFWG